MEGKRGEALEGKTKRSAIIKTVRGIRRNITKRGVRRKNRGEALEGKWGEALEGKWREALDEI